MTPPRLLELLRPVPHTHYVLVEYADAWRVRAVPAVCGVYVRVKEHANEPTCPTCRALIAEREASTTP